MNVLNIHCILETDIQQSMMKLKLWTSWNTAHQEGLDFLLLIVVHHLGELAFGP